MAPRPDEQIVISRRGGGELSMKPLARNETRRTSGARSWKGLAGRPPAGHCAATILPASHLYIEKLGELRSPVLP